MHYSKEMKMQHLQLYYCIPMNPDEIIPASSISGFWLINNWRQLLSFYVQ